MEENSNRGMFIIIKTGSIRLKSVFNGSNGQGTNIHQTQPSKFKMKNLPASHKFHQNVLSHFLAAYLNMSKKKTKESFLFSGKTKIRDFTTLCPILLIEIINQIYPK